MLNSLKKLIFSTIILSSSIQVYADDIAAGSYSATLSESSQSYLFEKELRGPVQLSVENKFGSISISPSPSESISIEAKLSGTYKDLGQTVIINVSDDGQIIVETTQQTQQKAGPCEIRGMTIYGRVTIINQQGVQFSLENPKINLSIKVPDHLLASLQISGEVSSEVNGFSLGNSSFERGFTFSSVNGSSSFINNIAKIIRVNTVNGAISAINNNGELFLKSVNGVISAKNHTGSLTVKTVNGNIDVRDNKDATVDAKSVNGIVGTDDQTASPPKKKQDIVISGGKHKRVVVIGRKISGNLIIN